MLRIVIALVLGFIFQAYARAGSTELTVITTKRYVSYTVGGNWKVLSMQTRPPTTAAVFQIPNPADNGTPDSTNLALMTFETESPEASAAITSSRKRFDRKEGHTQYKRWELFAQGGKQVSTNYSVRDAYRKVPGAFVIVRIAWPHLKQNLNDYDSRMETIFRSVLDSISGDLGPKPKKEGEVIRRPIGQ
jgi:hypothetical protein